MLVSGWSVCIYFTRLLARGHRLAIAACPPTALHAYCYNAKTTCGLNKLPSYFLSLLSTLKGRVAIYFWGFSCIRLSPPNPNKGLIKQSQGCFMSSGNPGQPMPAMPLRAHTNDTRGDFEWVFHALNATISLSFSLFVHLVTCASLLKTAEKVNRFRFKKVHCCRECRLLTWDCTNNNRLFSSLHQILI